MPNKLLPHHLLDSKSTGTKLACLTAYDYLTAWLLDEAGLDLLLVGDSLANVTLGLADTRAIAMPEILHHLRAVARGAKRALVVADMPFLSYQGEISDALANAGDLIRAGASMVKLEGGDEQALAVVAKLTASGIPVLAHIGHTPQSELQRASRSRLQGRDPQQARYLRDQAAALEKAGAFGVVLEMVTVEVATEISRSLAVPTIGIGSGAGCDGQILVVDDMLGLSPQKFRFVKRYAELSEVMMGAFQAYVSEVRSGDFPAAEHGFSG